jgi:hypothetical protein
MTERDPVVERELTAVDAALRSGTATAADGAERELQELALALAAESPAPDAAFAAALRERVEQGFPRSRPSPATAVRDRARRLRAPHVGAALAVAASLVIALAIAVPLLRSGVEQQTGSSGVSGGEALDAGSSARKVAPSGDAPTPGPIESDEDFAPGREDRRIERSASLTLAAPASELERAADEIVAVTDRLGGFVLRSSVSTGEQGTESGDFELRLPAEDLQRGLSELSRLGDVRARTQTGADITRGFVTASDRLEAARSEREGLLRRLERGATDARAEAIRGRLDRNAAEIDRLRSQLRDLRLRSDFATVAVTLERSEGDEGAGSDGLGAAVDDAVRSLASSLELLVRALGVLIPVALVGAVLLLGARTVRRRRREQALA